MLSPFYPDPAEIAGGHIGGVERYVESISRELASLGVSMTVVTSYHKDLVERDGAVRVIRVKRRGMLFRNPLFPWKRAIDDGYDLIHANATYPFLSDVSAKTAEKAGKPSLLSYHFEGKAKGIGGRFFSASYYLTLGRLMKRHDLIVAATRGYADASPFLSTVDPAKIRIIPYGIDTKRFNPDAHDPAVLEKYGLSEGYVLFVGRLVPYKGLSVLMEAAKKMKGDFDLVLAGAGPLEAELKRFDTGKFLGYVDDEDLPALYSGASVCVLPSNCSQEAFGITLIESMACGTPVIGTDLAGVKEVAALGGKVVPTDDPAALADAMTEMTAGSHDRKGLHEIARERFSWESVAKRYLAEYNGLIGEGT